MQSIGIDDYDDEEEKTLEHLKGQQFHLGIKVDAVHGLPKTLSHNVSVSYKFFADEARETDPCKTSGSNLQLDYSCDVSPLVTRDFIQFVNAGTVEFQVWGTPQSIIAAEKARIEDARMQDPEESLEALEKSGARVLQMEKAIEGQYSDLQAQLESTAKERDELKSTNAQLVAQIERLLAKADEAGATSTERKQSDIDEGIFKEA